MRICFLADAGSVNTRSWVDGFAGRLGHDVHVVSINRTGEFGPSVVLHNIGGAEGTRDTRGKLGYLTSIGRVRAVIRDVQPDLVIGYRIASYGYVGARTGFRPLAIVAQGQHIITPRHSLPKRIFAMTAIREANLIHSWAPHVTQRLLELGAAPEKILTCHRGIDLANFSARAPGDEAQMSVITTRRLSRWYMVDVIVRAIAMARAENDAIAGTIVGDGPARDELKELASELGVADRMLFTGPIDHGRLPVLLRGSSIYASAVPTDGVSASLLEAMATGCFPVVRDNAANRYWIEHGRNGLLVVDGDPRAYARAIVEASRNDELRARAASENRRIVEERADRVKNLGTIDEAYRKLVADHAAASPG